MPVLMPFIVPTVGQPQPVVAPPRRRRMDQAAFYEAPQQSVPQPMQTQEQPSYQQNPQQAGQQGPQQQFEAANNTAPYLQEQIQNFANRAAPPMLEPGQRVRSANAELVQPSNFKVYYEQLAAITQSAQEMLGAEQARAAFRRLQAMQAANQEVPMFDGMPVGYKNPSFGGGSGAAGPIGSGLGLGKTPLSGNRAQAQAIMKNMAAQWGWTGAQWDALVRLIMKESGFNPNAANPTSSARGLFQKMTSIHGPLENTIEGQILWGFNYIKNRYGNPLNALNFHLGHNWY